jgi:hypothetical protein
LIETAKAMGTGSLIENLLDLDFNDTGVNTGATINTGIAAMGNSGVMDLLSMDLEGMESPVAQTPEIFLTPENAQGLSLSGSFTKRYF